MAGPSLVQCVFVFTYLRFRNFCQNSLTFSESPQNIRSLCGTPSAGPTTENVPPVSEPANNRIQGPKMIASCIASYIGVIAFLVTGIELCIKWNGLQNATTKAVMFSLGQLIPFIIGLFTVSQGLWELYVARGRRMRGSITQMIPLGRMNVAK